jgi:hypothetical protein
MSESNAAIRKDHFLAKGQAAEKIVYDLALGTFLTDWCYLNPRLPDGKELCDLLVVFDDTAIIWQIKDLKLDEHSRYKKSEVEKNLRQLAGARRQLFDLKTKIELENPRRGKEIFDVSGIKQVFLISVLMGEGEEIFSFVEEIKSHTVHVFTRDFTSLVLQELDTVRDFCEYLGKKESFLAEKKSVVVQGREEELLGIYLLRDRSFDWMKEADSILVAEGSWDQLQSKPEYARKKAADKISYGWDSIIDRLHESGSPQYEQVARELARHSRFDRRTLGKSFYDGYVRAHEGAQPIFRRVVPFDAVTYCFLFVDESKSTREIRRRILETLCFVARGKYTQNKKVIGIATEKRIEAENSYDVLWLVIPEWTPEHQNRMEELQKKTGTLTEAKEMRFEENEYPQ